MSGYFINFPGVGVNHERQLATPSFLLVHSYSRASSHRVPCSNSWNSGFMCWPEQISPRGEGGEAGSSPPGTLVQA